MTDDAAVAPAHPGQCLVCGGRGGYPGDIEAVIDVISCARCGGTGRDPARAEGWYMDVAMPIQARAAVE